jgi:hypothetical protein
MQRYLNLNGDSAVVAFEIGAGEITVQFEKSGFYLYTEESAGAANILQMHSLALAGRGLGSFIVRVVKKGYARKWQ